MTEYQVRDTPDTTQQLLNQLNTMHRQGYTLICCAINHMIYKKTPTTEKKPKKEKKRVSSPQSFTRV